MKASVFYSMHLRPVHSLHLLRSGTTFIIATLNHSVFPTLHSLRSFHPPQYRTASIASCLSIPHASFIQSVTTQAIFLRISNGMLLFTETS
ncbi:MAG: hypothetical protein QM751_00245 [Paludibacteraceae bacterium]